MKTRTTETFEYVDDEIIFMEKTMSNEANASNKNDNMFFTRITDLLSETYTIIKYDEVMLYVDDKESVAFRVIVKQSEDTRAAAAQFLAPLANINDDMIEMAAARTKRGLDEYFQSL